MKAGLSIGIAGILIVLALVPGLTSASPAIKWTYHAGDAFLAGLSSSFSPDVARAANGDTVTIAGTGTFNPGGPATGGGTFIHKAGTTVKAVGTWTAVAVLSYETFGNAVLQGLSNHWFGGTLVLSVSIMPVGAATPLSGTLTLNCALGTPPAGVDEGIMVDVTGVITFGESVSGGTLFVLTP